MVASPALLRPRPAPPTGRPPAAQPYWPPGALAVAALTPQGCRWPLGEVWEDGFRFCGETRARGSYCARHHRQSRSEASR